MPSANYTFNSENRPAVPGALWVDNSPGPAPNTPRPGLPPVPTNVHYQRPYESDDHGWIEVKSRRASKSGWRGVRKARGPARLTMDELVSSLSGRSYLIA